MLTIRIHGERVREAKCERRTQSIEHRGAFATISRPQEHSQSRIFGRHSDKLLSGAVGAAVNDYPHRIPVRAGAAHGFKYLSARVVAGDENEVRRGARVHWRLLMGSASGADVSPSQSDCNAPLSSSW